MIGEKGVAKVTTIPAVFTLTQRRRMKKIGGFSRFRYIWHPVSPFGTHSSKNRNWWIKREWKEKFTLEQVSYVLSIEFQIRNKKRTIDIKKNQVIFFDFSFPSCLDVLVCLYGKSFSFKNVVVVIVLAAN